MSRIAQVGIAVGMLGAMITLMGLFPGVTGLEPTPGMGITQIIAMLIGIALLLEGAIIYLKYAFYAHHRPTLGQQIGTRLAVTGWVLMTMISLADVLGFGTHGALTNGINVMGELQTFGIIGSFLISSLGIVVYALGGDPDDPATRR